jgi:hypothetical protein
MKTVQVKVERLSEHVWSVVVPDPYVEGQEWQMRFSRYGDETDQSVRSRMRQWVSERLKAIFGKHAAALDSEVKKTVEVWPFLENGEQVVAQNDGVTVTVGLEGIRLDR